MGASAVAGNRVLLRLLRDDDLTAIESWFGEAARMAYEARSFEELRAPAAKRGLFAIAQPETDEPVGVVEYRLEGQWLAVPFITLAKAYRGWGYGSEAVRLLEEWATREGIAERFRAEVDARNGLGLYFWLRLGYRPFADAERKRAVMMVVRGADQ